MLPVHPYWPSAVFAQLSAHRNGPFLHSKEAVLEASSEASSEEAVPAFLGL